MIGIIEDYERKLKEEEEQKNWKVYEECKSNANNRVNSYLYIMRPHLSENDFHQCFRTCVSSNECFAFLEGKKKYS